MAVKKISNVKEIPLNLLVVNDYDLHKKGKGIKILKESIRRAGLLVPIAVRKDGNKYFVIDGMRRYYAWESLYPNDPISCMVLNYASDENKNNIQEENSQVSSEKIEKSEQIKQDAYSINMLRKKLPKAKIEDFVWDLHEKGLGYESIASCTGYKKSGIQKIINRLKNSQDSETVNFDTKSKQLASRVKRIKTELKKLLNELDVDNAEVTGLLGLVDDTLIKTKIGKEISQDFDTNEHPISQSTEVKKESIISRPRH